MTAPELVTVATAADIIEADLLKNRLEAVGVEVYLADEGIVAAHGLLANAVGGVKIQVAADDVERAQIVVAESRKPRTPIKGAKINTGWGECPKCHGKNLKPYREALGWKGVLLLFGIPLVRPRRMLVCNACEYSWRQG